MVVGSRRQSGIGSLVWVVGSSIGRIGSIGGSGSTLLPRILVHLGNTCMHHYSRYLVHAPLKEVNFKKLP